MTGTISSSGKITYSFKAVIEIEPLKKYFTLELTPLKEAGFYLTYDGNNIKKESFFGTQLRPQMIKRHDSNWVGANGGFDYEIDKNYFRNLMKKYINLEYIVVRFKNNWKITNVNDYFLKKVIDISDDLKIDPDDLMKVMLFETNGTFSSSYKNPSSSASGLIGFMINTAITLGTTIVNCI